MYFKRKLAKEVTALPVIPMYKCPLFLKQMIWAKRRLQYTAKCGMLLGHAMVEQF